MEQIESTWSPVTEELIELNKKPLRIALKPCLSSPPAPGFNPEVPPLKLVVTGAVIVVLMYNKPPPPPPPSP